MSENNFSRLAQIDVKPFLEKKQNLTYLSWPHAVNALMEHDPLANWVFHDPVMYGETMMVSCTVTAFNKPITMHLPVMDHRNQAVKSPDAVVVNKNMMRCLVKAIACHGLGLSVYAGEDLPSFPDPETGEVRPPPPPPKPESKPEPKPEVKPPAKIEGKEGPWQIKVALKPEGDTKAWVDIVVTTTALALDNADTEADVMQIFKVNRSIFDQLKLVDKENYDELMAVFKHRKEKLK